MLHPMARAAKNLGRRPGESGTREAIATAARSLFSERGYDRTTIRGIAEQADVDPALVNHFFGSKLDLFTAVTALPEEFEAAMPRIAKGPKSRAGERLAEFILDVLEDPDQRAAVVSLVRAAASEPEAARAVREIVGERVLSPIAEILAADHSKLRANLINSQMAGLVMARYVLELEPLASLPRDEVVQAIAPTLQRYLAGPLGSAA
jgi:AcrR family transcriptional regulator